MLQADPAAPPVAASPAVTQPVGTPPAIVQPAGTPAPEAARPAPPLELKMTIQEDKDTKLTDPAAAQYSFGQISVLDNAPIAHTFVLRNEGKGPLTIEQVQTSCGCTNAVLGDGKTQTLPFTLEAGGTAQVHVAVDPAHLNTGLVRKDVWVYVRGLNAPRTLEIAGTLQPAASFSPATLDFGQVKAGDAHPLRLTVTLDPRLAAKTPVQLASSDPDIRITPAKEVTTGKDAGGKGQDMASVRVYQVALAPQAHLGLLTGMLSLIPQTATDNSRALAGSFVPVTGEVTGSLSARPSLISFGTVQAGQAATQDVLLTGPASLTPDKVKVICGSPSLTAKVTGQAGQLHLQVSVSPKMAAGSLETQVIILSGNERLILPTSVIMDQVRRDK